MFWAFEFFKGFVLVLLGCHTVSAKRSRNSFPWRPRLRKVNKQNWRLKRVKGTAKWLVTSGNQYISGITAIQVTHCGTQHAAHAEGRRMTLIRSVGKQRKSGELQKRCGGHC